MNARKHLRTILVPCPQFASVDIGGGVDGGVGGGGGRGEGDNLAAVGERKVDRVLGCLLEVRVRHHDHRVLAAALEHHLTTRFALFRIPVDSIRFQLILVDSRLFQSILIPTHRLERLCCSLQDRGAGGGGARERSHVDSGVGHEVRPDLREGQRGTAP